MKHLKISMLLLFTVAIFISCEKETTILTEKTTNNSDDSDDSGLSFYFDNEDFFDATCYDLPMEDFSNFNDFSGFPNYLDQYTDNEIYSFGAITPNISFTTTNTHIDSQNVGFWPWYDVSVGSYLELATNFTEEDLIINFEGTNVSSVGMKVSSISSGTTMEMQVYGVSGYLGSISQYAEFWGPDYYFGVVSEEPITKIIISDMYNYALFSIDDVSFGDCIDFDADGCMNEEDAYPYSNLGEMLSIGENIYYDIDNQFVDCGTTMQDQIDNLIAQINDSYYGDYGKGDVQSNNWQELHDAFTTKLAHITYYWRINKLITAGERAEISSDAWNSDIPNMEPGD